MKKRVSGAQGSGRKKGSWRILELLRENLSAYFLSGLIALGGATVYAAAVWAASLSGSILVTLLTGAAAGLLLGPTLCGIVDTVLRTLRDMPGSWWDTYQRAWRQNTKQAMAFGVPFGLILSGQIFALGHGLFPGLTLLSLALLAAVYLFIWPQIVLVRLRSADILQNTVVLLLTNLGRSALCLLVIGLWALVLWLLLPLSTILWAIGGVWFPALLVLHILSGVLEDSFHVEATLTGEPEQEMEDSDLK